MARAAIKAAFTPLPIEDALKDGTEIIAYVDRHKEKHLARFSEISPNKAHPNARLE